MGRRPNPLILTYFERGPKLSDNSNRYPHRCKACGEDFPKGRIDSLINHLTKRCPAISEAERINACLQLHGINGSPARRAHTSAVINANNALVDSVAADNALAQTNWTALETLAEVSRQINEFSGKHDEHLPSPQQPAHDATSAPFSHPLLALTSHPFELQEQFTLENPPLSYDNRPQQEGQDQNQLQSQDLHDHGADLGHDQEITEDNLRSLLESADHNLDQGDHALDSNLSMAAAAAARLNTNYVDPHMHQELQHVLSEGLDHGNGETPASNSTGDAAEGTPTVTDVNHVEASEDMAQAAGQHTDALDANAHMSVDAHVVHDVVDTSAPSADDMIMDQGPDDGHSSHPAVHTTNAHGPAHDLIPNWGELTYIPNNIQPPATVSDQSQQLAYTLNKGGFRMDTLSANGTRVRHSRARFDPTRRKEVQEVRRIGACIRCRILRKVCSKGTPCDTCRKVLSPRVWHTGCTRTKLAEQIELYSAGVQIVVAQKRVNRLKDEYKLTSAGIVVEASHFHETGHQINLQVLQGVPANDPQEPNGDGDNTPVGETIMIDNSKEDIPAQVENYMRRMLPEFISRETSPHVRVTLECAQRVAHDSNDELLRRSLELWGLTEIMDRERQWSFHKKPTNGESSDVWLKDDTTANDHENEVFTTFCTQLTAGAERKAAQTSKSLLVGIQRNLQDGRAKLGFPMFLTAMIFLNCVEKMTWSFKAWDGEALRSLWPLEKQPDNYYNQGYGLCELLKMLLHIRHILPKISDGDPDQPIRADDEDEDIQKYYEDLNVTPTFLRGRRDKFSFDQSDSLWPRPENQTTSGLPMVPEVSGNRPPMALGVPDNGPMVPEASVYEPMALEVSAYEPMALEVPAYKSSMELEVSAYELTESEVLAYESATAPEAPEHEPMALEVPEYEPTGLNVSEYEPMESQVSEYEPADSEVSAYESPMAPDVSEDEPPIEADSSESGSLTAAYPPESELPTAMRLPENELPTVVQLPDHGLSTGPCVHEFPLPPSAMYMGGQWNIYRFAPNVLPK